MPAPNGHRIRARIRPSTYQAFHRLGLRVGVIREGRLDIGTLMDIVAQHLESLPIVLPLGGCNQRKLTEDQVRALRESTDKIMCLAAQYGLSEGRVCRIRNRKAYKWVK